MNPNLKKIIELSNHKWIQEQWGGRVVPHSVYVYKCGEAITYDGDWYFYTTVATAITATTNKLIWLPVGFNPLTGNWQIDDLLMEILKTTEIKTLHREWSNWASQKTTEDLEYWNHSDLNLKLMWLRELIKEIE